MRYYFYLYLAFFVFTIQYSNTLFAADYLFSNTAPIAVHKKKNSSVSFPKEIIKKDSNAQNRIYGIVFYPQLSEKEAKIDKEAMSYNALPLCKEHIVKIEEVFHNTEGSEEIDILIYDPRYSSQIKKAKNYKNVSVAWNPLYDFSEGTESVDGFYQELSRVMNPDCLPARFRFVYIGSRRYQEIRYGNKAWEEEVKDKSASNKN